MAVVGWIAVGIAAVVIVAGVVIGVRSIPDAQRYLKIRRM
jgi:hypothetical protein